MGTIPATNPQLKHRLIAAGLYARNAPSEAPLLNDNVVLRERRVLQRGDLPPTLIERVFRRLWSRKGWAK